MLNYEFRIINVAFSKNNTLAVTARKILLTENLFFCWQETTTNGSSFIVYKKKVFGQKIALKDRKLLHKLTINFIDQKIVGNYKCGHGFNYRHGARHNARIMAAFAL